MNIIDIALWVLGIWMLYRIVGGILTLMALKEAHEEIKERIEKIIHEVAVEKHGEMEYWFDKDTDQFLGQGKTIEEVTKHIKSRFPDHIFVLPPKGVICAPRWEFVEKLDASNDGYCKNLE